MDTLHSKKINALHTLMNRVGLHDRMAFMTAVLKATTSEELDRVMDSTRTGNLAVQG